MKENNNFQFKIIINDKIKNITIKMNKIILINILKT